MWRGAFEWLARPARRPQEIAPPAESDVPRCECSYLNINRWPFKIISGQEGSLLKSLSVAVLLGLSTPSVARASDPTDAVFQRDIDRWKTQELAADRDIELTEKVHKAFLLAAKSKSGSVSSPDVTSALAPLLAKFPDYRIRYVGPQDYCRVSRAISDARSGALNRKRDAVLKQRDALIMRILYNGIQAERIISRLAGDPLTDEKVSKIFLDQLSETRGADQVQISWSGMDYLSESMADDPCD